MYGEAGEGGGRARGDGGKGEEERFLTEDQGERFLKEGLLERFSKEGQLERFSKEAGVSWAMSSPVAKR